MPLHVKQTAASRALLDEARHDISLNEDARAEAAKWANEDAVPYTTLQRICCSVRSSKADADGGPWLHKVAAGGGLALAPPPSRKRAPELEERLAQLRQRLEEKQYADMVADVTVEERQAREQAEGGLVTFRQQMSFGLHTVVMMGTFYALGHVAGGALTNKPAYRLAGGLVGLTVAMLLETLLLILRTSFPPEPDAGKRQQERQRQQQQQWRSPMGQAGVQQAQKTADTSSRHQRRFEISDSTPPQEKKKQ